MDRSIDNYLHKKFKKQLNIEPSTSSTNNNKLQQQQQQQNDKENKEKSASKEKNLLNIKENEFIVPNYQPQDREDEVYEENRIINNLVPVVDEIPDHHHQNNSKINDNNKSSIISKNNEFEIYKMCISKNNDENHCNSSKTLYSFDKTSFKQQQYHQESSSNNRIIINNTLNSSENDYFNSIQQEKNEEYLIQHHQQQQPQPQSQQQQQPAQEIKLGNNSGKYVCNYCNLVCSKPSVLQKHIRAHTNERPYPCTSCGFSFKTRSNLYKHCRSRTHANRVMGVKAHHHHQETIINENNELNNSKLIYTTSSVVDNGTQTPHQQQQQQPQQQQQQQQNNSEEILSSSLNETNLLMKNNNSKPYKPRFHTVELVENNIDDNNDLPPNNNNNSSAGGTNFSTNDLSHHINEIINKNNSIVNSNDSNLIRRRFSDGLSPIVDSTNNNNNNNNDFIINSSTSDEPLNLTNKNRKRCFSEATEPVIRKSLIKELLLKNLYSDMQCPFCKMIFQTVTELELHKIRSCKGKKSLEAKYTRSSSVNVASILTKNKNAFDSVSAHFQNAVFPSLNSPGPFLGKTRLIESDKSKSFSFDNVNNGPASLTVTMPVNSSSSVSSSYVNNSTSSSSSSFNNKEEKKHHHKMFGGEVKIHNSSGETKSYRIIDSSDSKIINHNDYAEFDEKISENRLVQSTLQSGGTVLTSKTSSKEEPKIMRDVIRIYENTAISPNIEMINFRKAQHFNDDPNKKVDGDLLFSPNSLNSYNNNSSTQQDSTTVPMKYPNISDFSQNAMKLITPNLKHPTLLHISSILPSSSISSTFNEPNKLIQTNAVAKHKRILNISTSSSTTTNNNDPSPAENFIQKSVIQKTQLEPVATINNNIYNPMNLLVNGKVIRYVPGMPGPAVVVEESSSPPPPSETIKEIEKLPIIIQQQSTTTSVIASKPVIVTSKILQEPQQKLKSPLSSSSSVELLGLGESRRKFGRPNSLALKPTSTCLKQHHGLTPTLFNQILISPDTPRVAKKYAQHLFNGNYFSYLGLKSSTKPVYCTLNKTQPFYVPHFKKLSMYSEWRQQDTKVDKMYVTFYDSRQRNGRYTTAGGKADANLMLHSSYKFVASSSSSSSSEGLNNNNNNRCDEKDEDEEQKSEAAGFECTDNNSSYIRGRGRYVCDQCGIRCKKPSMLKKHLRTHSNDRPYTCNHCNFSFKTKGNLTKHMKSQSHTKNYTATSCGNSSSNTSRLSGSQSSDSDTEDSGMDSSDESMTRQQEHEAAYGLLSLSQKTNVTLSSASTEMLNPSSVSSSDQQQQQIMTTEEVAYVSKTNYAKNKILDNLNYKLNQLTSDAIIRDEEFNNNKQDENLSTYLGKTCRIRPLMYPYTCSQLIVESKQENEKEINAMKSIKQFHVIQKYAKSSLEREPLLIVANNQEEEEEKKVNYLPSPSVPMLKINDVVVQPDQNGIIMERKRKISVIETNHKNKLYKNDEVIDLSVSSNNEKRDSIKLIERPYLSSSSSSRQEEIYLDKSSIIDYRKSPEQEDHHHNHTEEDVEELNYRNIEMNNHHQVPQKNNYIIENSHQDFEMNNSNSNSTDNSRLMEYDNSAMETLADVATKQVKLDKNSMAKNVASEFLKLAKQVENFDSTSRNGIERNMFISTTTKEAMNDMMVKSEGNKNCTRCAKSFNKPFQLKLHMNIHYLERPFRCDTCSVSFRTKGHLQKHERSAAHYSKLSSSPAQSSSEPRPFKCSDCSIAFRIHGHLAKHLRSKSHIMKLECLRKIPFGLYAELERSNSLLTEINTSDGDQCLESLKTLAKKVCLDEPGKLQNVINEAEDFTTNNIIDSNS